MKTLRQLGTDLGELLEEKNAAYGSSFAVAGSFLRLLFPDGVPADRYDDALLMVRIFDKQMRIATNKDAFGESPYQDIAGYGLLGVHLHQQRKDSKTWPGIVSEDAGTQSKAQPDGVALPTKPRTTPSASERPASEPSTTLAASLAEQASAPVLSATDRASRSEAAARRNNLAHSYGRWNYRHNVLRCIACEKSLAGDFKHEVVVHRGRSYINLSACSDDCHRFCCELMVEGKVEGVSKP
jgi:hypothetical protein